METLFSNEELNDLENSDNFDRAIFITDENYLQILARRIKASGKVSFDIETTGLEKDADLVGFGLSWQEIEEGKRVLSSVYVPVGHITNIQQIRIDTALEILQDIFNNCIVVMFNASYELKIMRRYNITIPNFEDVRHSIVCYDENFCKKSLKDGARELLNLEWGDLKAAAGRGKKKKEIRPADAPIEVLGKYCIGDVEGTIKLSNFLSKKIPHSKKILEIEREVTPIVVDMELRGIKIDLERANDTLGIVEAQLEDTREKIYEKIGKAINLDSPKQVAAVLFDDLGLTPLQGRSTDVNVLQSLSSYEVPSLMLEYREKIKLKTTYLIPLIEKCVNGRIHCNLNQLGAESGRFTSSGPNLQNIPAPIRDKKTGQYTINDPGIRQIFIPSDGMVFFDVDFSQIEGRVFAHVTDDPVLISAYKSGGDIHTATSEKLGIHRNLAKTINFAIIYGCYPSKLVKVMAAEGFTYSFKEAKQLIYDFWSLYETAKDFVDSLIKSIYIKKYAETIFGRRRHFAYIGDAPTFYDVETEWGTQKRQEASQMSMEREAVNFVVQGTAADIMKLSLVDVNKGLKAAGNPGHMLLTVHDELLTEVYKGREMEAKRIIEHRMTDCAHLCVPIEVSGKFGNNWGDVH